MREMNKKKILVFHPALAPYRTDFFNSIHKCFDANFFFYRENLQSQKFDNYEMKKLIDFVPKYLNFGDSRLMFFLKLKSLLIIIKSKPDIILCSEYDIVNFYAIIFRFFSSKKYLIITICDDTIKIANSKAFYKKICRKLLFQFLDGVILTHVEIIRWYKLNFKLKSKLMLFPIVRLDQFFIERLNSSSKISNSLFTKYNLKNKKVFLYVGRFARVKNINFLIDAFSQIAHFNKDAVLFIIGSGELEMNLRSEVKNLKLENRVFLPGRLEGEQLLAFYRIADVFILPSVHEPFGAVINEALLSGCYVLSSKEAGGASLIKENINGNTFDPYNIEELVCSINQTLSMPEIFNKSNKKNNRMLTSYDEYFLTFYNELKGMINF
jgi:glycosyltransferase involved in cell wall biosynthesis